MGWFCCGQKKDEKNQKKDEIIGCPRCHRHMVKKSSMGVTIDKCERCDGIWLDGGEIENIISKLEKHEGINNNPGLSKGNAKKAKTITKGKK
ncbi:MAG: zf-TFIIB domain-containing protein [archaeon]